MKHHSERVPGKNFRPFCGVPLYRYIVESLLASPFVEGVSIDTDSPDIVQDVQNHFKSHVHIIQRPEHLCGDFAPFLDILRYDLSQVDGDYFIQAHSTSPLVQTATINRAVERFLASRGASDSLLGATRLQVRLYNEAGQPLNHDPADRLLRTQSLAPVFEENSSLYLFTRETFMKCGRRVGDRPLLFEMPRWESIDIDTEADFQLAERIYQCQSASSKN